MKLRKRILLAAASVAVLAGAGTAASAAPAHAGAVRPAVALPSHQVCDEGSPVECLNDWGAGSAGLVKTYDTLANANDFNYTSAIGLCQAGSDLTTNNCPFVHVPAGQRIIQINNNNWPGKCVGDQNNDPNNATSALTTCGGWGAYFIVYHGSPCAGGYDQLVSIHWSSDWFSARELQHVNYTDQGNGLQYYNNGSPGRCLASS